MAQFIDGQISQSPRDLAQNADFLAIHKAKSRGSFPEQIGRGEVHRVE
jgi:hypothetical protein